MGAKEYANSMGLRPPRNVLIPRTKVHVHLNRHNMQDLPETDDDIAQWCRDAFAAKDDLLDTHRASGTFGDQLLQDSGRSLKSLLVVISWAVILLVAAIKFLQWSSILSSWKGIISSSLLLALMIVLMHILVLLEHNASQTKVTPRKT